MNYYDAIIFDLDGTLWDASEASAVGWNKALAQFGHTVSASDIQSVSGKPLEECVRTLLPTASGALHTDALAMIDEYERSSIEEHGGRTYEGVAQGLAGLAEYYRLFLVSNCQQWYLECFWKHSKSQIFFAGWDCHGVSRQPKASMIKGTAGTHNLQRAIYVGDTASDELAARVAEVDFGYAAYGFGKADAANIVFNSFSELVAWLRHRDRRSTRR